MNLEHGGLKLQEFKAIMKSIGRELTEKGFKKMKQMDTNGNGKIEEGEVILGEDSEGNDYSANTYIENCFGCPIIQVVLECINDHSCVKPGTTTKPGNS